MTGKKLLKAIIIDDEPGSISGLQELLKAHGEVIVVRSVTDPLLAVDAIAEEGPDLLFLDIQMPAMTGFDIATELQKSDTPPSIIFITAFDKFAIDAIRHAAFDFLVKPIDRTELSHAIERLHNQKSTSTLKEQLKQLVGNIQGVKKVKISKSGGFTLLNPDDIVYILADWNYAEIHFDNERFELSSSCLGDLEEKLPSDRFFRISKSHIINITYLKDVSRRKREVTLVKDDKVYRFPIPLLNIRRLEKFLT